jgi:hypothetical protein
LTDVKKGFLKWLSPLSTFRCPTKNNPAPSVRMLRINVEAYIAAENAILPKVKGCGSGATHTFYCT